MCRSISPCSSRITRLVFIPSLVWSSESDKPWSLLGQSTQCWASLSGLVCLSLLRNQAPPSPANSMDPQPQTCSPRSYQQVADYRGGRMGQDSGEIGGLLAPCKCLRRMVGPDSPAAAQLGPTRPCQAPQAGKGALRFADRVWGQQHRKLFVSHWIPGGVCRATSMNICCG